MNETCRSCGQPMAPTARFCRSCGTPAPAATPPTVKAPLPTDRPDAGATPIAGATGGSRPGWVVPVLAGLAAVAAVATLVVVLGGRAGDGDTATTASGGTTASVPAPATTAATIATAPSTAATAAPSTAAPAAPAAPVASAAPTASATVAPPAVATIAPPTAPPVAPPAGPAWEGGGSYDIQSDETIDQWLARLTSDVRTGYPAGIGANVRPVFRSLNDERNSNLDQATQTSVWRDLARPKFDRRIGALLGIEDISYVSIPAGTTYQDEATGDIVTIAWFEHKGEGILPAVGYLTNRWRPAGDGFDDLGDAVTVLWRA